MRLTNFLPSRRGLLHASLGLGAWGLFARGAFAEELARTPPQTEGPFYPDKLPLDTDNDLLILNDNITPAVGAVTWLSGRILDSRGQPTRRAPVAIWPWDNRGGYLPSTTRHCHRRARNIP